MTPRSRIERIQSRATEGFRLTTEEFTRFLDEACRETQQAVCEALSNHNRVLVEHGADILAIDSDQLMGGNVSM